MTLNDFLQTEYKDFGRGPNEFDCWGMTISARQELFSRPPLPLHKNISPDDKNALTIAALSVRDDGGFKECEIKAGAIATAWSGSLCLHIGLVIEADGRYWILETNRKKGPSLTSVRRFSERFSKVIYYDN